MKTFLVVEEQDDGCDYTIGCGIRATVVQAESLAGIEEALRAVLLFASGHDIERDPLAQAVLAQDEGARSSISVYEISDTLHLDLEALRGIREARLKMSAREVAEAAERAEYERLRKKFG
jgi:hypothetical protein